MLLEKIMNLQATAIKREECLQVREVKKNLSNSLEKIQKFADHPAILCWKIKDEPDITSNSQIANEVPGVYRALKAADPNHPIELTMAIDATLKFWSNFCDIVQIDRYPVRSATDPVDLTPVASFSRNAKSAVRLSDASCFPSTRSPCLLRALYAKVGIIESILQLRYLGWSKMR